jgi:hypothetical protein
MDLQPTPPKDAAAAALEQFKAERAKATKDSIAKMPVSYFAADYLAQYGQHTVTVRVLDDTLAKFNKKITKRILAYCQHLSDSIVEDGLAPLRDRVAKLEKELAEMKANPPTLCSSYQGTWQPGGSKRGDVVTQDGSLWLAMSDTDAKPGGGDTWKLIVKRGRDGKDLRS